MSDKLKSIREKIDVVDDRIAEILCERAELAREVRRIKKGNQIAPYSPTRENEIIQRVLPSCLEAGYSREQVENIFLSIISACRSIVGDIEISVCGDIAYHCHAAVLKQFGIIDNLCFLGEPHDLVQRVAQGLSHFGAFEVSRYSAGIRLDVLEQLISHDVYVIAERSIYEEYSVYSFEKDIDKVSVVYGEGVALEKTGSSIQSRNKSINLKVSSKDILQSPKTLSNFLQKEKNSAFVAASGFASYLNIPALIQSLNFPNPDQISYYIIGRDACPTSSNNVTAIVCALKDNEGALRELLRPFSEHGLTLRKIESRNRKGADWECIFFLEIEGAMHQDNLKAALDEVEPHCNFLKILGSFSKEG